MTRTDPPVPITDTIAATITTARVRRLLRSQFPQWSDLPVTRIRPGGWDNRSFRLGSDKVLRLPAGPAYAPQVAKEQLWLPRLAPALPLPVPLPLARGRPGQGYPFEWSVMTWIEGTAGAAVALADRPALGRDLAAFLRALQQAPATGAPAPGAQNFHRGGDLGVYHDETLDCIAALAGGTEAAALRAVWDRARASRWGRAPVWVHGDVAPGNLLMRDGRLAAVIDFGGCAAGDPACDLAIRWLWPEGPAAGPFVAGVGLDDATWDRARGWALWKSLLGLRGATSGRAARRHRQAIAGILAVGPVRG